MLNHAVVSCDGVESVSIYSKFRQFPVIFPVASTRTKILKPKKTGSAYTNLLTDRQKSAKERHIFPIPHAAVEFRFIRAHGRHGTAGGMVAGWAPRRSHGDVRTQRGGRCVYCSSLIRLAAHSAAMLLTLILSIHSTRPCCRRPLPVGSSPAN